MGKQNNMDTAQEDFLLDKGCCAGSYHAIHLSWPCVCIIMYTIWLFNIAMENPL